MEVPPIFTPQPTITPEVTEVPRVNIPEQTTTVQTPPVTNIEKNNEKVNLDQLSEQKPTKLYEDETDDDKFFDDFFSDE